MLLPPVNEQRESGERHGEAVEPVVRAVLYKSYPPPTGEVLEGLKIECRPGEVVALLGPSGSGKSTLLDMLAGLAELDPRSEALFPQRDFTYAFQKAHLVPWRDCEDNAYLEADLLEIPRQEIARRVDELMELVELDPYRSLFPSQLSEGMKQRLQLVRAASVPAEVLLLDEPLGAVDRPLKMRIARQLRVLLVATGSAAVWVTHDSREAVAVADRVLVLSRKPMKVVKRVSLIGRLQKDVRGTDTSPVPTPSQVENPDSALGSREPDLQDQATALDIALAEVYSSESPAAPSGPQAVTGGTWTLREALRDLLVTATPLVLLFLVWEVVVTFNPALQFYLPAPSTWLPLIATEFSTGGLARHTVVTLRETGLGLLIGLPSGLVVGYLASSSRWATRAIRPYLVGLTAVPLFVLAPAFILWFGIGESMKVAIAALSCFPFVGYMVHDAAVGARGRLFRYFDLKGAKAPRLLLDLVLPATIEAVILSLRPAAVAALIGAFLGEFIAANEGLGYYIIFQASRYRMAEVLVGVAVLFAVATTVEALTRRLASHRNWIVSLMSPRRR